MKKYLTLLASSVCALLFATSAFAAGESVSVNVKDFYHNDKTISGSGMSGLSDVQVVNDNWNNIVDKPFNMTQLKQSDGAMSSVSISGSMGGGWCQDVKSAFGDMGYGYCDGPWTINFSHIPYPQYDIILYMATDWSARWGAVGILAAGDSSPTYYAYPSVDINSVAVLEGDAIYASSTINGNPVTMANTWGKSLASSHGYGVDVMRIKGLTASSLIVTIPTHSGENYYNSAIRSGLFGFQIVNTAEFVSPIVDLGYARSTETSLADNSIVYLNLTTAECKSGTASITLPNENEPNNLTFEALYVGHLIPATATFADGTLTLTLTVEDYKEVLFGETTLWARIDRPSADTAFADDDCSGILNAENAVEYYATKVTGAMNEPMIFGASSLTAVDKPVYTLVTGGDFSYIFGGADSHVWSGSPTRSVNADIYVEMAGGTTDWLYGGNHKDGLAPNLTGDIKVVVSGTAVVNGSIGGGGFATHGSTTTYGSAEAPVDLSVMVKNMQTSTTTADEAARKAGYIVGGGTYQTNVNSIQQVNGNTSVTIDLPESASGTFVKSIVGGGMIANGGSDHNTPTSKVTGNATVTVKSPAAVTFSGDIVGGGYQPGAAEDATVGGNTVVSLTGGTYTGDVTAGGVGAQATVKGTATLNLTDCICTGIVAPGKVTGTSTLNIAGAVEIAELESFGAYSMAEDAILKLGTADLSAATTPLTIIKGAEGIVNLGTNRNVVFAGFEGGEVALTTDETVTTAELAFAEGVTDCSKTIFTLNDKPAVGTIHDDKIYVEVFDTSAIQAPYKVTIPADTKANWTALSWTDANGEKLPVAIWGMHDPENLPEIQLTLEGDATIHLPVEVMVGAVKVSAGDFSLTFDGDEHNPLEATSLEVVSGTVSIVSDVVLAASCKICADSYLNYTCISDANFPSITGDGTFIKNDNTTLTVNVDNKELPKVEVLAGELRFDNSNNKKLNITVFEGAKLSVWGAGKQLSNSGNIITLKSGSTIEFSNGNGGKVSGSIILDAENGSVSMLGTIYGSTKVEASISGKGELLLAQGGCGGYANAYEILGDISGDVSIRQEDSNNDDNVTLSGANTYSGTTTINQNLKMSGESVLPGAVTIASGKKLKLKDATLENVISGAGAVEVTGGTVTLKGSNTYTGGTGVTAGTLKIAGSDAGGDDTKCFPDKHPVTVAENATLELASGYSYANISGAGTTQVTGTYTLGITNGFIAADRNALSTSAINITTTGVLQVRAWGASDINVDSLTVNGKLMRDPAKTDAGADLPVTVGEGATLAGLGTIELATTFADGATLTVGAEPLTITGAVTLPETGTVNVTLPADAAAGTVLLKASGLNVTKFTATTDLPADTKLDITEDGLALVAKVYVAQVTHDGVTTGYETFDAAAWNTVVVGDTVTILGAVTWPETIPEGVTITRGADADVAVPDGYEWDEEGTLQPVTTAAVATAADLATALAKDNLVTITVTEDIEISGELTLATGKTLIIPAGVTVTAKAGPLVVAGTIEVSGVLNGYELPYGAEGLVPSQGGTVVIGDTGTVVMPKVWENAGLNPNTENLYVIGDCEAGATIIIGDNEVWICDGDDTWMKQVAKVGTDYYSTLAEALEVDGEVTLLAEGLTLETYTDTDTINLNGKTLALCGDGGELAGNLKGGGKLIVGAPVTLAKANTELTADIEINQVLTVTDKQALNDKANGGTITGAGTLVIGGEYKGSSAEDPLWNRNGLTAEAWKGTVSFRTTGDTANFVLTNYGNTDSTIEFNGATGRFYNGNGYPKMISPSTVRLTGEGLQVKGGVSGSNNYQRIDIPKLVGTGTLKGPAGAAYSPVFMIQDMSGFEGDINLIVDGETQGDNMSVVIGATPEFSYNHADYKGRISIVANTAAVLPADAAWTAKWTTKVYGTLSGSGTMACGVMFVSGSTYNTKDGAITVTGGITYENNLKIKVAADANFPVEVLKKTGITVPTTTYMITADGTTELEGYELVAEDGVLKVKKAESVEPPKTGSEDGAGTTELGVVTREEAQAKVDAMNAQNPTIEVPAASGTTGTVEVPLKVTLVGEGTADSPYVAQLAFDEDNLKEAVRTALTPEVGVAEKSETEPIVIAENKVTLTISKSISGLWYGYATGSALDTIAPDYSVEFVAGQGGELTLGAAPKGSGTSGFYRVIVLPYKPAVVTPPAHAPAEP